MYATIARWIRPRDGASAARGSAAAKAATVTRTATAPAVAKPTRGSGASAPAGLRLQQLPGVDVAAGLATTLQNEGLYLRLLRKFHDGQQGFAEQFRAARAGSDPTAPARLAHTLKGTAGNVGARGVQAAAGALEKVCLEGATPERLEQLLDSVTTELGPVLAGLEALRSEAAPSPAPEDGAGAVAIDPKRLQELTSRLEALLAASDTDAADTVEELARAVAGSPMAPSVSRIAAAIAEYDFDVALEALRRIEVPTERAEA
jgi:HPt (histidine-containing phosphotransfer) domain-containing protein